MLFYVYFSMDWNAVPYAGPIHWTRPGYDRLRRRRLHRLEDARDDTLVRSFRNIPNLQAWDERSLLRHLADARDDCHH